MTSARWLRLCACLIALSIALLPAYSAQPAKRGSPPPPPAPWPYTKVIRGIEGIASGDWKEEEVIRDVLKNKVDFAVTNEVRADLRKHGASDAMIDAILKVSLPPPPEVRPKKIPTGNLAIQCTPAECDVTVNGNSAGATRKGELEISKVPAGDVAVDLSHKGYITQQKVVRIGAGGSNALSVALEPDFSTKAEFGGEALKASLTALGLGEDQKQLWVLAGNGTATSWDAEGKQSAWDIVFEFGPPNLLKMDARSAAGHVTLFCRAEHCEKKKGGVFGGSHGKSPILDSLTANLTEFARCHLAAMLGLLTSHSSQPSAVSFDATVKQDQHFAVETSDMFYHVTLAPEALLSQVVEKPRNGLDSGLTVTYGSYFKIANFEYPSHTTVKLPGKAQHGLEVRFDFLRQESNLREKDFPPE